MALARIPAHALNAFRLAPRIRLLLTIVRVCKLYLLIYKRGGSVAEWLACWTLASGIKSQPRRAVGLQS